MIKGRDIGFARFFDQFHRMQIRIAERLTRQHHFATAVFHRIHFDIGRGFGHHNDGFTTQ